MSRTVVRGVIIGLVIGAVIVEAAYQIFGPDFFKEAAQAFVMK